MKDRPQLRRGLLLVGVFGTYLFYGDGSSRRPFRCCRPWKGVEVISPALHRFIIPITLIILLCLFVVQNMALRSVKALAPSPGVVCPALRRWVFPYRRSARAFCGPSARTMRWVSSG